MDAFPYCKRVHGTGFLNQYETIENDIVKKQHTQS